MLLTNGSTAQAPIAPEGEVLEGSPLLVQLPIRGATLSATPYVSESTVRTTVQELRRAAKLAASRRRDQICSEHQFFQRYQHYVQFDFLASSQELMQKWLAWGRLQMKEFVQIVDSTLSEQVSVRPWPELFDFKHETWPFACAIFIGLVVKPEDPAKPASGERRTIDLRDALPQFIEKVVALPEAQDHTKKLELIIRHVRPSMLQSWRERQQNGLVAQHPPSTAAEEISDGNLLM